MKLHKQREQETHERETWIDHVYTWILLHKQLKIQTEKNQQMTDWDTWIEKEFKKLVPNQ